MRTLAVSYEKACEMNSVKPLADRHPGLEQLVSICDILGIILNLYVALERSKTLPPPLRSISEIFDLLMVDQDGVLSKDEMVAGAQHLNCSALEATLLFNELDLDKTGYISVYGSVRKTPREGSFAYEAAAKAGRRLAHRDRTEAAIKIQRNERGHLSRKHMGLDIDGLAEALVSKVAEETAAEVVEELPPGWYKAFSAHFHRTFYHNRETGESSWVAPKPPFFPSVVDL